jgi:hypothetical protein
VEERLRRWSRRPRANRRRVWFNVLAGFVRPPRANGCQWWVPSGCAIRHYSRFEWLRGGGRLLGKHAKCSKTLKTGRKTAHHNPDDRMLRQQGRARFARPLAARQRLPKARCKGDVSYDITGLHFIDNHGILRMDIYSI